MRNMYVGYKGGANSRAGTAFVGYSKQVESARATGKITFAVNPSPGDTITLNSVVWTFVAAGAAGNQTNVGGTLGFTIAILANNLNASANANLIVATYTQTATGDLTISYDSNSPAGNTYTLAASSPSVTLSGPTLAGAGNFAPRLITFQFSIDQGLVLEFGNKYMRVIANGALVTEATYGIANITRASPCVFASGIVAVTGDWVFIANCQGMPQINNQMYVVTSLGAGNFSLADVFGAPIDSTAFGIYTGGGTVARIYTLTTPFGGNDIQYLKYTQSADVMSLTCRNLTTGTEYAPYELSRLADNNWTLAPLNVAASIAAPTGAAGTATVVDMTNPTDYQYVITAIDAVTGDESSASNIADIANSVNIASTAGSEVLTWNAVVGRSYYNIYKAPPAYKSTVPQGSLYGFAGSSFSEQFVDSNIIADMTEVPPLHQNPFARGQALSVTVTTPGSGVTGINYVIHTTTGSGAAGYGVVVGGVMTAFVFTNNGQNYVPTDTITFSDSAGHNASGTITFAANPLNGSTVTLNGVVWTFVSGVASGNQVHIGSTVTFTVAQLAGSVNASGNPLTSGATLVQTAGNVITVTYNNSGAGGNAYTLAASAAAVSGGTLVGGSGGIGPTGTLNVGPQSGTYPAVVAYFQERRVYANTANQPDTYWMSQPGSFKNFDSRIPTISSDAIEGTPWSVQVDGIQFMLPLLGGLVALTGQAAYQVMGNGGSPSAPQPITPSSQQALPQAYNGCHFFVPPVKIDYDIYYLQAKGAVIRSLSYNFWINVFTGVDVTILSSHLFNGYQISAMTWCEEPFKIMWAVRSDGVLLSMTSLKAQDVMGWARHDTQGTFISATSVTELPVDALYLVTQRYLPSGHIPYMLERMDDRLWTTVENCWCVDAGLELPQSEPNANLNISSATGLGMPASVTITNPGLNYDVSTTVIITDPTGSGCTVTPLIASGQIIGMTFSGGTGYTNPQFQITDPTNQGGGFTGTIVLNNIAIFVASAAVFSPAMIGWVIRLKAGGIATISAYTAGTIVQAQITSPFISTIPNTGGLTFATILPGAWTLTQPVTTVSGLNHLIGMKVTGLADGNVIPPQTVSAQGTITLGTAASAVIVGLGFTAQLQSLYLEGGNPTVQGRRKKVGAVTTRVELSGNFKIGTNQPDGSVQSPAAVETIWTPMTDVSTSTPGLAQVPYGTSIVQNTTIVRPVPLYTGDIRALPTSGFAKPGQVAVQQSLPLPLNVLDFVREVTEGDIPEDGPKPRQARG